MVLEVALHDGPNGNPPTRAPAGIARRDDQTAYEETALWEMTLTLLIRAPEIWWKQANHYFQEIVWLRARPEISEEARCLTVSDFEEPVPTRILDHLNELLTEGNRGALRAQLPDSFIRNGLAHTTMETLLQIGRERGHYNSGHWRLFCDRLREISEIEAILGTVRDE